MRNKVSVFLCLLFMASFFSCKSEERKEIKASEILKLLKQGKDVYISNKIILDDLNFSSFGKPVLLSSDRAQVEILQPIFISNCVFMGKISSNASQSEMRLQSVFRQPVRFINCDFRGELDLSNAVFWDGFSMSSSIFRENCNLNGITVWSRDAYFSSIKAEKDFTMIYAVFQGDLNCMEASFSGIFSMQETSVRGKLSLQNTHFASTAGLDMMEVGGAAFFNYALFDGEANFSYSRFLHSFSIVKAVFSKKLVFNETVFYHKFLEEGASFAQTPSLNEAFFLLPKKAINNE